MREWTREPVRAGGFRFRDVDHLVSHGAIIPSFFLVRFSVKGGVGSSLRLSWAAPVLSKWAGCVAPWI